jgi:hypothetical protein
MDGKYVTTRVDDGIGYIEIAKGKANTYDLASTTPRKSSS